MAVKEKIRIRVRGYDHQLVDAAAEKIVETAKRTGAKVSGPIPLPTDKEIVTILRAVHKYKDSREQFEMRTHKRLIDILRPSNKTVEALTGLELPAGVEIESSSDRAGRCPARKTRETPESTRADEVRPDAARCAKRLDRRAGNAFPEDAAKVMLASANQ